MNRFKTTFLSKQGNDFLIGLLIVFAGLGIGMIVLTYRDYNDTSKYAVDEYAATNYQYVDSTTPLILDTLTREEQEYKEVLLTHLGKDKRNDAIGENQNYKTRVSILNVGDITIIEEYVDKFEQIYLCKVDYSDGSKQNIQIIMRNENSVSMNVVDESGVGVDEEIKLPLSIMEHVLSVVKQFYNSRGMLDEN